MPAAAGPDCAILNDGHTPLWHISFASFYRNGMKLLQMQRFKS